MTPRASGALLAAALLWAAASRSETGEWPQYRGPERLGTAAPGEGLATPPPAAPTIAWRRPIGAGYSGVVGAGDRLYTMEADGEQEAVLALSAATGEPVWRVPVGSFVEAELGDGGPRSTPALAGDRLVAISSQARLVALAAADGRLLWEKDLTAWGPVPRFGYAMSPLVEGGQVVVAVGEREKRPGVIAFDLATGELRWSALEGPAAYTSPVLATLSGERQLVFALPTAVVGLSLAGEALWRHETAPHAAIPMPVVVPPDRLFVSSSEDSFGGLLLRVERGEEGYRTEQIWSQRLMRNHFNSSVAVGGHLYGFDNGTLRCLDAASGERLWSRRGFGKGSLVAAGERLFVLSDGGTLALVRADPAGYREEARLELTSGRSWTEPSLIHGRLLARDFDELVSVELSGPSGGQPESASGEAR